MGIVSSFFEEGHFPEIEVTHRKSLGETLLSINNKHCVFRPRGTDL